MIKFLIFTVILTPFLSATAFADVYGLFMVVKGEVKVTAVSGGETSMAKVGKKVFPGDIIEAAGDSRAKVVMSDKNVLNISPDTKVKITIYQNDDQGNKKVELNVLYGKVRATVEQKYDPDKNTFQVKTPNVVAGVRGTDFLTSYNPKTQESLVVTFRGLVAVGLPDGHGKILNPVLVKPGEWTTAPKGAAPAAPQQMQKSLLQNMNKDTAGSDGPRGPASVATAVMSVSGMVDAKDMGTDLGKDIQMGSSTQPAAAAFTAPPPPPMVPPPMPPSYVQGAITGHNSGPVKLGVTINPH